MSAKVTPLMTEMTNWLAGAQSIRRLSTTTGKTCGLTASTTMSHVVNTVAVTADY